MNLGTWASILSLPSLVITYVIWIKKPGIGRSIVLVVSIPIAIISYAADIADRLGFINISNRGEIIIAWGVSGNLFQMTVNTRPLLKYKDDYKLMLILEARYGNIDRMTDTHIEKSDFFTIHGEPIDIIISMASPIQHLLISPPPNAKPGDQVQVRVDFDLALVPKDLASEQIKSLSDLERLGGKIIGVTATNVSFEVSQTQAPISK